MALLVIYMVNNSWTLILEIIVVRRCVVLLVKIYSFESQSYRKREMDRNLGAAGSLPRMFVTWPG